MFNFLTSFKSEVKRFIASAEDRFKALEDKLEALIHKNTDTTVVAQVTEAVEAETKPVEDATKAD